MSRRGISTIGRSGLALVSLVVALLALPAVASAADGGFSGVVTFGGGGGPVADAEVCADSETDSACATTAADGSYQLAGLAPGSYRVSFEASDANPFVVFWPYPTDVTVASGANQGGIDAELVKGGAIEGTVADSKTGAPLGGIVICAWSDSSPYSSCDLSAGDGSFKLFGVSPGSAELVFLPSVGHESKTVESVPISPGGTLQVEAHLAPQEGRIGGGVYTASSHTPIGGVAVCAIWAKFHETAACTRTDDSGAYEFFPVPPGQFKVVFSPEPSEVEFDPEATSDLWPTQFWNQKPTFATAETLTVTRTSTFAGIDGLLGTVPVPPTSGGSSGSHNPAPVPVAVPPKPTPKPLQCGKGKVKKRVKGKARCVKRHKPRHHGDKRRGQR